MYTYHAQEIVGKGISVKPKYCDTHQAHFFLFQKLTGQAISLFFHLVENPLFFDVWFFAFFQGNFPTLT